MIRDKSLLSIIDKATLLSATTDRLDIACDALGAMIEGSCSIELFWLVDGQLQNCLNELEHREYVMNGKFLAEAGM